MIETQNKNPEHQNNFDGTIEGPTYIVGSERVPTTEVNALLEPGDAITATEPFPGNKDFAPIMAKVDLGEAGNLSIIKIDLDDPNLSEHWRGQIPYDKYKGTMASRSLMAIWTSKDHRTTRYSDVFASAGLYLSGRDKIGGGPDGTPFYAWGDSADRPDRKPETLPADIPKDFLEITRNRDASVTLAAQRKAKNVHVKVMANQAHEEVIGDKWAAEIEAARKPVTKRVAMFAGKLASKAKTASYK